MKCILRQLVVVWSVSWSFLCVWVCEVEAQDAATKLRVGVATADINTAARVTAQGDEQRVRAKAIVLAQGDTRAALVFCDVIGIPRAILTAVRKEIAMATYYIGADVHVNNTELAVEHRRKIVARYSVPTTIPAISTVLGSLQGRKILAMEEGPMAGWLFRNLNLIKFHDRAPFLRSDILIIAAKLETIDTITYAYYP